MFILVRDRKITRYKTSKQIMAGNYERANQPIEGKCVLMICTSAAKMGDKATGLWLEELAAPVKVFEDNGLTVDIVSVNGGAVPLDPRSIAGDAYTHTAQAFDQSRLAATRALDTVDPSEYAAVFFPGGHGASVDFPDNKVGRFVGKVWDLHQVIGAVCHGPAAFTSALMSDDQPLIKGVKLTCSSNAEEKSIGFDSIVPFLLESKLRELGAEYSFGSPWAPYVVVDGNLITGQNPASSTEVAEKMVSQLKDVPG